MTVSRNATSERRRVNQEKVIGFSPEAVAAPFSLRCASALIDYLTIVCVPVLFLFFARILGESGSNLLNGNMNSFGWILAIFVGFANLFLLPLLIGQTIGKFITGIRIVRSDGSAVSAKRILLRQFTGIVLSVVTLGLGFLICVFTVGCRSLHDLIFRTVVIQANKEPIST